MASAISMDDDHPGAILAPAANAYRIVARFTPMPERERPLFEIERLLRHAATSAPGWSRFIERMDYGRETRVRVRLRDGWVAVDGSSTVNKIAIRVAANTTGQVVASLRVSESSSQHDGQQRLHVDLGWIVNVLRYFAGVLEDFEPEPRLEDASGLEEVVLDPVGHAQVVSRGLISAELRDIQGAYLSAPTPIHDTTAPNAGVCETDAALTGDMAWSYQSAQTVCAACVCEIAVHFRDNYGGVGLNPNAVKTSMDEQDARDRTST